MISKHRATQLFNRSSVAKGGHFYFINRNLNSASWVWPEITYGTIPPVCIVCSCVRKTCRRNYSEGRFISTDREDDQRVFGEVSIDRSIKFIRWSTQLPQLLFSQISKRGTSICLPCQKPTSRAPIGSAPSRTRTRRIFHLVRDCEYVPDAGRPATLIVNPNLPTGLSIRKFAVLLSEIKKFNTDRRVLRVSLKLWLSCTGRWHRILSRHPPSFAGDWSSIAYSKSWTTFNRRSRITGRILSEKRASFIRFSLLCCEWTLRTSKFYGHHLGSPTIFYRKISSWPLRWKLSSKEGMRKVKSMKLSTPRRILFLHFLLLERTKSTCHRWHVG